MACDDCQRGFLENLLGSVEKSPFGRLLPIIAIVIMSMTVLLGQASAKQPRRFHNSTILSTNKEPERSNWVTISYGRLIDGSTITHNGETISQVVRKVPHYDENLKGLVQQYLEPYSVLCHDVLLAVSGIDTLPLVNITSYYPVGSEQPAWATLFREGHFQLYFNAHLIRLFLKGSNPRQSFDEYHSVVRHAIQNVLQRYPGSIKKLEVYAFANDYARMEIRLNTVAAVYSIDTLDLSAKHKQIDLASIESLLQEGVILEAVEVDDNNDLYFYGRKAPGQTIAGFPVSLSDIAVIYRAVFHHGYNAPYVSLDKHEDNRFAKVNFGGHLENTRVGRVVLEADKLFKTLSTGIDPNTHEVSKSRIAKYVSGFLTEDERSLLEDHTAGHSLIRYWFYPDSIGTVTNGSIGVVLTHQFLADVERMDAKVSVSEATRETIDHLNRHFNEYENAEDVYSELGTVGRIMALVNWLKGMRMNERVELDDFLSVSLPAFTTPLTTRKMLAVSAVAFAKNSPPSPEDIRARTRVFCLSDMLDKYGPDTKDEKFTEIAFRSIHGSSTLALPRQKELQSIVDAYKPLIRENELRIGSLARDIERSKDTLDLTSEKEVDRHNSIVERYNSLIQTQKSYIDSVNEAVQELIDLGVETREVASIGGGIDLNPKKFRVISRDATSPRIREVIGIKSVMRTVGKVSRSGDWIRNELREDTSRVNPIPRGGWTFSKKTGERTEYSYQIDSAGAVSMSLLEKGKGWESNVSVNQSCDVVRFSETKRLLEVTHSVPKGTFTGRLSPDRRRVVFSK
jgi:hypothetical protein